MFLNFKKIARIFAATWLVAAVLLFESTKYVTSVSFLKRKRERVVCITLSFIKYILLNEVACLIIQSVQPEFPTYLIFLQSQITIQLV